MDNREEVRDFLRTRRARITPDEAGVPVYGSQRRVPGLRREEVAMLAGVSIDYYVRLERGNLTGVSESVLDAVAAVLKMDETERRHLADLARAAQPAARSRRGTPPKAPTVPVSVRAILDAITEAPALVRDDCMNILATNALGRALYAPVLDPGSGNGANFARFAFLDPGSRTFWLDWERSANETVGALRAAAGHNPYDKRLTDLVGELSTRSEDFRARWAEHQVYRHASGAKRVQHPVVGRLEMMYDSMGIAAAPGLTLQVYTAEPGSSTADALRLLGSWVAEQVPVQHAGADEDR